MNHHSRANNRATPLRRYTHPIDPIVRLICFPNAGAGASIYRRFAALLPHCVELLSIQLPGREDRINETPYTRMGQAASIIATDIARLDATPTVLFGHSMGALLAFETARELTRYAKPLRHLIVSGEGAPDTEALSNRCRGDADDHTIVKDLLRLGGTPPALLEDPSMQQLIIKVIRADYTLLDHYHYQESAQLNCPITAFASYQDTELTPISIEGWAHHTTNHFNQHWFQGDHFYLFTDCREFVQELQKWILFHF